MNELKWEIDRIEKMDDQSKKVYSERLLQAYEKYLSKLEREKNEHNLEAFKSIAWRAGLIGVALCGFAGPALAAFGTTAAAEIAGGTLTILAIAGIIPSMIGMIASDDDGPKDIKVNIDAAKECKKQMDELKKKIKQNKEMKVSR